MNINDLKTNKQILYSIIIPCYNHSDYFEQICYALKYQQNVDIDTVEIIVAHDGSENEEVNTSKHLVEKFLHSKIVWQPDEGFRVSKSRNNAIRLAQGKLLIFLDGDMIPDQYLLQKHIKFHKENKFKPNVLAGNRKLITETAALSLDSKNYKNFFKQLRNNSIKYEAEEEFRLYVSETLQYSEHPWRVGFTCNLSVPNTKQVVFDEKIQNKFGHEDLDLMYRLWRAGYGFKYDNNLIASHVGIKKSGYLVHENASSKDLVHHVLTGYYMMHKHPDEPFMENFLNCLQHFYLGDSNEWYFSETERDIIEARNEFEEWLKKEHNIDFIK